MASSLNTSPSSSSLTSSTSKDVNKAAGGQQTFFNKLTKSTTTTTTQQPTTDDLLNDEAEDTTDESDDDLDDDEDNEATTTTSLISSKDLAEQKKPQQQAKVYDILGNQLKFENNKTVIVLQNKARDLGLLTLKAIILGPLIGLTLKAALIRGLLWAVGAYFMHLFFPSLLSTLGLGTGLVGFARHAQQPDYTQMIIRAAIAYLDSTSNISGGGRH